MPAARRKIQAQQALNLRRGKDVTLYTQADILKGQVATVTASKVMLRQSEVSEVTAVNLEDVLGIS